MSHPPASLTEHFETLAQQIARLETELQQLNSFPRTDASPYWQDGRYLYLLHPRKKGMRRLRDYIGNSQEKVAEALAMVERSRKARQIEARIQHLQLAQEHAKHLYSSAFDVLISAGA